MVPCAFWTPTHASGVPAGAGRVNRRLNWRIRRLGALTLRRNFSQGLLYVRVDIDSRIPRGDAGLFDSLSHFPRPEPRIG